MTEIDELELGYDVPAKPGMREEDIQTPCLILDLDALERNIRRMSAYATAHDMRLRVHAKMHKSVDVALLQIRAGAVGLCCQKVSEAETFVRAGIEDILVTNQVRDPAKIDRLARLSVRAGHIAVCVDDPANVEVLSAAAERHKTVIACFVELDCGAGRCGVETPGEAVALARKITAAEGLRFEGLQAYQGKVQHLATFAERKTQMDQAFAKVEAVVRALDAAGLKPEVVSGGGTGSYPFESASGLYNELQCGSYAFMDADYGRVLDADGNRLDAGEWENALFILTGIMSHAKPDLAVCDAGLKVQSIDSGLPTVFRRPGLEYIRCADEHGVIADPDGQLAVNEKLRLVPGHCDPTCNIHDWYVGVRAGVVERLWPVSARGKFY